MAHHLKLVISTHFQKGKISHVATTNDVEERDSNFERVSNFRASFLTDQVCFIKSLAFRVRLTGKRNYLLHQISFIRK